jgi:hypothetical protein
MRHTPRNIFFECSVPEEIVLRNDANNLSEFYIIYALPLTEKSLIFLEPISMLPSPGLHCLIN